MCKHFDYCIHWNIRGGIQYYGEGLLHQILFSTVLWKMLEVRHTLHYFYDRKLSSSHTHEKTWLSQLSCFSEISRAVLIYISQRADCPQIIPLCQLRAGTQQKQNTQLLCRRTGQQQTLWWCWGKEQETLHWLQKLVANTRAKDHQIKLVEAKSKTHQRRSNTSLVWRATLAKDAVTTWYFQWFKMKTPCVCTKYWSGNPLIGKD